MRDETVREAVTEVRRVNSELSGKRETSAAESSDADRFSKSCVSAAEGEVGYGDGWERE